MSNYPGNHVATLGENAEKVSPLQIILRCMEKHLTTLRDENIRLCAINHRLSGSTPLTDKPQPPSDLTVPPKLSFQEEFHQLNDLIAYQIVQLQHNTSLLNDFV